MMLISKDTNPNKNIYFVGADIINALQDFNNSIIDFFELYNVVNKKHRISMQLFIISIDWLFLLGVIKIDEKGKLVKCF